MIDRKFFGLIPAMLLVCSSCSAPGTLVASEAPNQLPSMVETPDAGMYALFVEGESSPLFSFRLTKGEKIGFEQSSAGVVSEIHVEMVYAVAGQVRFPLDIRKSYEWRKE